MKIKVHVEDINIDDLVNLFSTAVYGSQYFDVRKRKSDYYGTPLEDEYDYRETTWAKVLLSGKPVYVLDYYSEEEAYGELPHVWDERLAAMKYTVTIEDIKNGLQKAIESRGWDFKCAMDLINEDGEFDLTEAENLLQIITFGEAIYG